MSLTEQYRSAMAQLPGVVVVAARSGDRDITTVVTSLVSVSLEPPMLAVVVHTDSRLGELLEVGRPWAATVMASGQSALVAAIAQPGRPDIGQLEGVAHSRGEQTGAALLHGSAWVEARTVQVVEVADHHIVVGTVLGAGSGPATGALVHRLGRVRDLTGSKGPSV